jgi:integrase
MQNTVKSTMERLHAMLQKACNYGYPINNTFREVTICEEEVSTTYLSMTEITRIYYYDKLTKFQKEIKDLFIVGCLTGLRYSDYSQLSDRNFINNFTQIRIKTRKTGIVIQVPAHKFVREILEKYNYSLPKRRCIQHFNKYMKLICKKVGFTEKVPYERTVGTQVVRKELEKWEVISSHTARRSFATNMFLAGVPAYRIMLITGHQSERSFFRYVRITREENALALSNHQFFQ